MFASSCHSFITLCAMKFLACFFSSSSSSSVLLCVFFYDSSCSLACTRFFFLFYFVHLFSLSCVCTCNCIFFVYLLSLPCWSVYFGLYACESMSDSVNKYTMRRFMVFIFLLLSFSLVELIFLFSTLYFVVDASAYKELLVFEFFFPFCLSFFLFANVFRQ